ncbi:MAG: ssDNA-binding domain-containing protein [Planctomycetota bacterium]|jgi:antirestriction protein ArdC/phage/plasmid primase-like uncharacterized protein|nr:ssDNA-binding domain-containing protein [Planctomycetota bacterium]
MSAQSETTASQRTKPHFNTRIANQLARQLRDGEAPMQRQGVQDIPYNPATGRTFHGINAMSLMMQGRKDDRWFAFEDAAACGYKVKNGEKGTPVQKWPRKQPGETMNKAITTYVFNAEQLDRIPPQTRKPERPDPLERVADILKNSGVAVVHDQTERAFYAPRKDEIHLPKPENCASKEKYCEMALYEYFKATGHPSRQDRETWNAVSAAGRAQEELICTAATMTMCAEIGIPHDPARNPDLALDWAKSMEHHPLDFARAMQQSDVAVFATLRQERARDAEIGFQSNEPWRPVPEASPLMAVETFMRQNEAIELAKTEPEKLHSFEHNDREIFALPDTGVILGKKGDIDDDGRVEMRIKAKAYDREGDTYSVVMTYTVQRDESGLAALTAPARAEEIQPSTKSMALPIDWDGTLEVRGCADDMDGNIRSDITDPEQIQFYGVYANTKDGIQYHMADFDTEAAANTYTRLVNKEYNRQMHIEADREQPRSPERESTRDNASEPAAPQRDSTENQQSPKGYTLDDEQKKALYDKAKEHVEKRNDDLKATHDKTAKRLKSQVKRFEIPKERMPYMKAKDIQLHPGVYQNGNSTCVPLYNNNGEMRSMAYVQEDSTTRYAKNSDRQGCYHIIGGQEAMKKAPVGIIANEYATAAKISESVGLPVMACMDKDNIVDAVKEFHAANPDKPIIIAADRTAEAEAGRAAAAVSAAIVFPAVSDKAQANGIDTFNDLARAHGELGKDAVRGQIQPAIEKEVARKAEKAREQEAKVEKSRGEKELARA